MANTVIALKKSGTPSAIPLDLANGELAINYADGKIFYKAVNGTIQEISGGGGGGNNFGTVNANGVLVVAGTSGDVLTLLPGDNIGITADSLTDTITISATANLIPAFDQANAAGAIGSAAYDQANAAFILANNTLGIPPAISQIFVANGSQTTFTLANSVAQQNNTVVSVDGLVQIPELHYTISGTTLTFTSQPVNQSNIEVRLFSTFSQIISQSGANTDYANAVGLAANTIAIAAFDKANTPFTLNGQTIYLGNTSSLHQLSNSGYNLVLNSDGSLTVPNGIQIPTGSDFYFTGPSAGAPNYWGSININWGSSPNYSSFQMNKYGAYLFSSERVQFVANTKTWNLDSAGDLTFPDGTKQSTAYVSEVFDKANSANLLAYNTGVGANAYASSVGVAANTYADTVGISANTFASATIAGANAAVGTGANAYADIVGTSANAFTSATIAGANTAVGTGANAYSAIVGTSANAFTSATIAGANTEVGAGANSYADTVGTSANAFTSATIAGANTAVGAGANSYADTVGTSANLYADVVGSSSNDFTSTTIAGANTAVGAGANAFTSATIAGANTAVGTGANNYSNATFVRLDAANQTITGNLNIVGNFTLSGNTIFLDATRLQIDDPLIYLAGNNYTSDVVDIGFIANYVNATGSNVHTGLYREHENKMYYLFNGYDKEPINNHIGAMSNNMTLAVLNADMITSNLTLGGQNTILWIRSAYDQANAANLLAYNTGIGANAFTSATIAGANTAVGAGANAFTSAAVSGANTIAIAAFVKANSTTYTSNVVISVADNTNSALRITQTGTQPALEIAGNTTITGTGRRIIGDFSNATVANRLMFQTSTTNGASYVHVLPNGTSSAAGFIAYASSSDPGNTSTFQTRVALDNNQVVLYSNITGTGTYLPMTFYTSGTEKFRIAADATGTFTFGGTAPRITGDFSNATFANRVFFQSSGTNTQTAVGVLPNGTSQTSQLYCWNNSDPSSAIAGVGLLASATDARIQAQVANGGTALPMTFYTNQIERARLTTNGDFGIGTTNPVNNSGYNTLTINGTSGGVLQLQTNGTNAFQVFSGASAVYLNGMTALPMLFYTNATEKMRIDASGNVSIGTTSTTYKLEVNGSFAATTKSFVINHPTKPGKKLRYGSLEGPENGVYVRGKLVNQNTIELPEYWTKLVDPNSITVQLTPIGKHHKLYVDKIEDNKVYIKSGNIRNKNFECFYIVYAERIDVEKLEVEVD